MSQNYDGLYRARQGAIRETLAVERAETAEGQRDEAFKLLERFSAAWLNDPSWGDPCHPFTKIDDDFLALKAKTE
jgi:hypothetical protein